MSYRLVASVLSLFLFSCSKSSQTRETTPDDWEGTSLAEAQPWPKAALEAAGVTEETEETAEAEEAAETKPQPKPKPQAKPQREAKTAQAQLDEDEEAQDFSGVDTTAPVDDETDEGPREIVVEGIKGTTSNFDVRVTLENRAEDFDRCHDRMGGGGGRIVYRIHIEANGDVGRVKARRIRSRNRKLVACYTEVVSSSHFPKPHGGYADVKWTTKVGRSRKRPNSKSLYDRPHRWDTPAGSRASR